jgi:hypothetical protein
VEPSRQYGQRGSSRDPEHFQRETSNSDFKRQQYADSRENYRREGSPPREWEHYGRGNSPPRNDIKKEKSPPREGFRRSGSVPRTHHNDKRGKSPPRSDDSLDRPLPPPEFQRNKHFADNYPPNVIYVPDDKPWSQDKENVIGKQNKKWKKNKKNGDNDFQQPKPKKYKNKQQQYEDKIESDPTSKQPQYGPRPDWDYERAKLRENQRVQQNWDNDFRPPERQRKRQQHNWQIERDRVREKFRKGVQV